MHSLKLQLFLATWVWFQGSMVSGLQSFGSCWVRAHPGYTVFHPFFLPLEALVHEIVKLFFKFGGFRVCTFEFVILKFQCFTHTFHSSAVSIGHDAAVPKWFHDFTVLSPVFLILICCCHCAMMRSWRSHVGLFSVHSSLLRL